jgi:hypothetical protein
VRRCAFCTLVFLGGLFACRSEFRDEASALQHFDAGRKLLDQDRPTEAASEFAQASRLDPESVSLVAWHARAVALAGDPAQAAALLEPVVKGGKADLACAYNQAAYLAAAGRSDDAMKALEVLLGANPESGSKVLSDPDFDSLHDLPGFVGLLHLPEPTVTMQGEAGRILIGDTYDLSLDAKGPAGTSLDVVWEGPDLLGFAPVRVVDEREIQGDVQLRHLAFALRATRAGAGELGPWKVSFSAQSVAVSPVPFEVVAPAGMALPDSATGGSSGDKSGRGGVPIAQVWLMPRDMLADRVAPSATIEGDWLVVAGAMGDEVVAGPEGILPGAVQLEVRDDEHTTQRGTAWRLDDSGSAVHVRIRHQQSVVLETDLAPSE